MAKSKKKDPSDMITEVETIRQNRRNVEEVFNSILAAHGCDTYYPLIFPPREGVDF